MAFKPPTCVFFYSAGVEIDFTQSVYTVPEDDKDNQVVTLIIKNSVTVQGPIPLRLTAMGLTLPEVDEAERATPGQDFHVESIDAEIPPGAVGMFNISLRSIIIDDSTVENHIQRFSLMVEITDSRAFFDSDNSTRKTAVVAFESDDGRILKFGLLYALVVCYFLYTVANVSLSMSDLVFNEEDDGPFNVCLLIVNEGTDTDCPVEFQVNYTLNFTKYSSECKPLTFRYSSDLLFFSL